MPSGLTISPRCRVSRCNVPEATLRSIPYQAHGATAGFARAQQPLCVSFHPLQLIPLNFLDGQDFFGLERQCLVHIGDVAAQPA